MSYATPKRLRFYFRSSKGAEAFAAAKREEGARDVVVVAKDFTDRARFPLAERPDHGADVIWTELTED